MQSTQPPKSTPPLKEADPHDVFAIESILAARADHRAPPLAHDPASQPAAPQVHVAPEISVAAAPQVQIAPEIRPDMGASAPPVVPTSRATDIQVENNRPAEIRVDDLMPLTERPTSKWGKRIVMGLLGLCSAIAAAAWQHYGDHAKAMAVSWTPQSVVAALSPSETPPAAQPASAPVIQAAVPDQTATTEQPATSEQAAAPATVPSAESGQLQSMAQDLAAMTRQVEELKASIAQLRTSHAQMAREVAKATDARASEARPPEQAARPRVAAVPSVPPPRAAAPPARKPPPAQAAYIPPVQPLPPPPAPVQAQPAPPPLADDGAPVVRPPMPLR
jgi:hypothetical protein